MSGRISLDDRAMDDAARKLRSVRGNLHGVQGRLTPGLAGGAPPAIASRITSGVAEARASLAQVESSAQRQSDELRRRAALARLADGRGTSKDFGALLALCAGRHPISKKKRPDLWKQLNELAGLGLAKDTLDKIKGNGAKDWTKDTVGGLGEAMERWAAWWKTHSLVRKPGVAAAGVGKFKAWLSRKTYWRDLQREIKKHAKVVKALSIAGKAIRIGSIAMDIGDIVVADTQKKRFAATGSLAGGLAGGYAGAQAGAAIGAFGGPVGVAVGAGVGGVAGAVIGSGVGKAVGDRVSDGFDAAKGGVKKAWGAIF